MISWKRQPQIVTSSLRSCKDANSWNNFVIYPKQSDFVRLVLRSLFCWNGVQRKKAHCCLHAHACILLLHGAVLNEITWKGLVLFIKYSALLSTTGPSVQKQEFLTIHPLKLGPKLKKQQFESVWSVWIWLSRTIAQLQYSTWCNQTLQYKHIPLPVHFHANFAMPNYHPASTSTSFP